MALDIVDFKKFEGLFISMEKQLVMQTSFMESMYNLTVEEREDRRERENLLDVMRREELQDSSPFNQPDQLPAPKIEEKEVSSIFSSLLGMIPGVLSSISLSSIGSLLIKGGIIAIVAPAIGDFVEGFTKKALDDLNLMGFELPEGFTNGISSAIGDAAQWGSIAKLIGGKIGAIVGLGGFVYEQINKLLDPDQNGEIESGFLEGFNPETLAGIGAALSAALALALPKLISRSLPGILGTLALPAIMPDEIGADGKPKAIGAPTGPRRSTSTVINGLKSGAKFGAVTGAAFAGYEIMTGGDPATAVAAGVGSMAGSVIGGAIGSLGGPIGIAIGSAIGGALGDYLGREGADYFGLNAPDRPETPQEVQEHINDIASAEPFAIAMDSPDYTYTPKAPLTPEQIAENEAAIAAAEPFSIPMQTVSPTATPVEKPRAYSGYYLSDSNMIIGKSMEAYLKKIAPGGDISFALDQERVKRLDQINQDAATAAKGNGAMLNAMSAPSFTGGSTISNDNRTTIINNLSQPAAALDQHYIPQ